MNCQAVAVEPTPEIFSIKLEAVGVGDGFEIELDDIGFDEFVHSANDDIAISEVRFVCHALLPLSN